MHTYKRYTAKEYVDFYGLETEVNILIKTIEDLLETMPGDITGSTSLKDYQSEVPGLIRKMESLGWIRTYSGLFPSKYTAITNMSAKKEMLDYYEELIDNWSETGGVSMMSGYKLVRDKIPDIIHDQGENCIVKYTETDAEYESALSQKLYEEIDEYQKDGTLEELADVVEVISAIAERKGSSLEEVNQIRLKKHAERGGFGKGILLKIR